jgi:endonuclease-8
VPEGDTIFRTAQTLRRALAGRVVTRFDTVFPHLSRVQDDTPVTGRTVDAVQSAGKHLLIAFSGDLILRSHMRMSGSWHLYRPGERWQRSKAAMRIVIGTDAFEAVAFNVPDASFHTTRTLARDSAVGRLGPDLLADSFDEMDALRRLRLPPDVAIGLALLDQWRLAGIGNVYKSEVLFLCQLNPSTPVSAIDDERLRQALRTTRRLMLANAGAGATVTPGGGLRRTTGRADPEARLWVYDRRGEPCRRCGTPVTSCKLGPEARTTFWCEACQPALVARPSREQE